MKEAFYILFGAGLTVAVSLALGLILFRRLQIRLARGEENWLALVTGSALLSAIVFMLCCLHLARRGVFLGLGLTAIAGAIYLNRRDGGARDTLEPIPRRWKWVIATVFALFAILYFFNSMAPEMSPDGTTYHLPFPAVYYRAHGFVRIPWNIYANISQGVEMLFLFAYAFGRQSAAALVHFSFLVSLPWLMISYGRRFGCTVAGIAGALICFASPVFGKDGSSAYVDVALAAVVFALFYLLQIWDASRDSKLLVPIGILAGFSFATKYTAVLALPYALGFIGWKLLRARKSVWRPMVAVATLACVFILPWLIKNWLWMDNPVVPFANRLFPNPYVHVSFEDDYRLFQRLYTITSYWRIPYEVTVGGAVLCGFLGPLFLLIPIALLALRSRTGRQLLLAGGVFALPYLTNIGTRFLIPAAPFWAIAFALALANVEMLLLALVLIHAVISWPNVAKRYCAPTAWLLERIPVRQALRLEPESSYLSRKFPQYLIDREIEKTVPPSGKVFSFRQIPEAYMTRQVLVRYLCAQNEVLADMLWTPLFEEFLPNRLVSFSFARRGLRGLRVDTTSSSDEKMWSVSEFRIFDQGAELPRAPVWRLTANPNPWDVQLAFDNSPVTRWRSWQHAHAGMYIQVDFGRIRTVDAVRLEMPEDWIHPGLKVEGLDESGKWEDLGAKREIAVHPVTVNLRSEATSELKARGIRYLLIGNDDIGAEDFQQHAKYWGIRQLSYRADMRLYYIE